LGPSAEYYLAFNSGGAIIYTNEFRREVVKNLRRTHH